METYAIIAICFTVLGYGLGYSVASSKWLKWCENIFPRYRKRIEELELINLMESEK